MKKIFLSLVFLFGVGTFVMADDTMKVMNDTVTVEDGFKNIDLKEVPQSRLTGSIELNVLLIY